MRWYSWILTPVLTAIFGLFAAGLLAALLVEWYRVSSFEGGSGFFVIGIALVGGLAGLIVGLIAAIVVARRPAPGLLKALGYGWGASLAIVLIIGGAARFFADIPPQLGGQTLYLHVELRWPPGAPRPTHVTGAYTRLHSATTSGVRKSEDGPLWLEDVREEDGRWIVPGAVAVFTQRGKRLLDLGIADKQLAGFVVPLPGHPRAEHEKWSEWLPRYQPGAEPPGGGYTYRFRVVRDRQPIRVVQTGPFEIAVVVNQFFGASAGEDLAANSTFRVAHNGQPIAGLEQAEYVAFVSAAEPTLFVRTTAEDGATTCRFVVSVQNRLETADLGSCVQTDDIAPLTSDPTRFTLARTRRAVRGWPDRVSFKVPGLYLAGELVLDTRARTARTVARPGEPYPASDVPPLTLSPDERSMVLFATTEERPFLQVIDTVESRSYALPIDPARMRFSSRAVLDPAWVNHHFEWTREPGGHDTLRARERFEILPYQGEFTDEASVPSYRIGPGLNPLRDAVISILTAEMQAQGLPDGPYGGEKKVRLDGHAITVSTIESGPYVYVAYEGGSGDVAFMRSVAARLDAAFATKKWDTAFGAKEPTPGH